ncbi:MAG: WxcM-like domain-containing protein [Alphaproteobacteria bacterium]|nr:WxcM-like domain-containing protein [Alphaproteobacteria bacterium]
MPALGNGTRMFRFAQHADARGGLSVAELGAGLPFRPARLFLIHDVPAGARRGAHAHRRCCQLAVAVAGELTIRCDDGRTREDFRLRRPDEGLYLPPLTWTELGQFVPGTVLLVLASEPYDAADYVRDPAEFRRLTGG